MAGGRSLVERVEGLAVRRSVRPSVVAVVGRSDMTQIVLRLLVVLPVLAMSLAVGGSSPTFGDQVPAPTVTKVTGATNLDAIACASGGGCVASGQAGAQQMGVIVPTSGLAGGVHQVSGSNELHGVACSSGTTCVAVGVGSDGSDGVVVPINNGAAGGAATVGNTGFLRGVACAVDGSCVGVGWAYGAQYPSGRIGVVVPIIGGSARAVELVSGTLGLEGVGCPSEGGSCVAVGDMTGGGGAVVTIDRGTAGGAQASGSGPLTGVACATETSCVAVGSSGGSGGNGGVVVPITNGAPGAPVPLSAGSLPWGVACPSSSVCWAVGDTGAPSNGAVFKLAASNGAFTIDSVTLVPDTARLYGVFCTSGSSCVAAGQGVPLGAGPGVVVSFGALNSTEDALSKLRQDLAIQDLRSALLRAAVTCGVELTLKTGEALTTAMEAASAGGFLAYAESKAGFEALEVFTVALTSPNSKAGFSGFGDACDEALKQITEAFDRYRADPPDSGYQGVALPVEATVAAPDLCGHITGAPERRCTGLVTNALALARARQSVGAIQDAIATATNRLSTARAAQAAAGVGLQTAAIAGLANELIPAVGKQNAAGAALADEFERDGISLTIEPLTLKNGLQTAIDDVTAQGVSSGALQALVPDAFQVTAVDYVSSLRQATSLASATAIGTSITLPDLQALEAALAPDLTRDGRDALARDLGRVTSTKDTPTRTAALADFERDASAQPGAAAALLAAAARPLAPSASQAPKSSGSSGWTSRALLLLVVLVVIGLVAGLWMKSARRGPRSG